MANCKASLNLNHFWVNIKDKNSVYNGLYSLLEVDNDLTENEDYFQDDTLELGYENEADRIVREALKGRKIHSISTFKKIARKVAESITNQEYYGECKLSFVSTNTEIVIVAFATGGDYRN